MVGPVGIGSGPSAPSAARPAGAFTAYVCTPVSRRRERPGRSAEAPETQLLADAELVDEGLVPARVAGPEVVEQPSPLADEVQEPAAAVVVLLVRLEVLGEMGDPLAEE